MNHIHPASTGFYEPWIVCSWEKGKRFKHRLEFQVICSDVYNKRERRPVQLRLYIVQDLGDQQSLQSMEQGAHLQNLRATIYAVPEQAEATQRLLTGTAPKSRFSVACSFRITSLQSSQVDSTGCVGATNFGVNLNFISRVMLLYSKGLFITEFVNESPGKLRGNRGKPAFDITPGKCVATGFTLPFSQRRLKSER